VFLSQDRCGIENGLEVQAGKPALRCPHIGVSDGVSQEQDSEEERGIGDAVDQKRFGCSPCCRGFAEPITDQQVASGPDTFPECVHHEQVMGEDQHGHREDEPAEDRKVTRITVVAVHVPFGVDRDHRRDRRDGRKERQAERIDTECKLEVHVADLQVTVTFGDLKSGTGRFGIPLQQDQQGAYGRDEQGYDRRNVRVVFVTTERQYRTEDAAYQWCKWNKPNERFEIKHAD